jgi:predicted nucleotide-binding protein (sugar kinase/HSP70/actin superfamily)
VVAASPALVRASFALADDALGRRGIALIDDTIDLCDPERLREQMHAAFGALLEVSRSESDQAVTRGAAAMTALDESLQASGADIFDALERNRTRGAVLIIARPYHADPGVSHHVGDELQSLGYPVLTIRSLPREPERLDRWLRHDLASGRIEDPFDIRDLLPDGDNSGSIERVWAARIAAAHGRLGVVDVSSFKCAQDAGTYAPMRTLFETSGTVCCRLHDLDETRPATSLRIRLRTFVHALEQKGLHPWSHSSVA